MGVVESGSGVGSDGSGGFGGPGGSQVECLENGRKWGGECSVDEGGGDSDLNGGMEACEGVAGSGREWKLPSGSGGFRQHRRRLACVTAARGGQHGVRMAWGR